MVVTAWSPDAGAIDWLFCENETNVKRLFGMDGEGSFKDGFNDHLLQRDEQAIRRDAGTRAAAHAHLRIAAHGRAVVYMRWHPESAPDDAPLDVEALFDKRIAEADAFYGALQHEIADADQRLVQRQALAGMLWSKQYYQFDVTRWLDGDPCSRSPRNSGGTCATPTGGICAMRTSCRCPTNGNTRGMRRGTSRFMRRRSR